MKTNVMRILDAHKIKYIERTYDENLTEATSIADVCNVSREKVFKTLVLIGNDKNHYVCVIPSYAHLNLKKAAKAFKKHRNDSTKRSFTINRICSWRMFSYRNEKIF